MSPKQENLPNFDPTPDTLAALLLPTLHLETLERAACIQALRQTSTISDAAKLCGISRHGMKRRIFKFEIVWLPHRVGTLLQTACDAFNREHPVGTKVRHFPEMGKPESHVRTVKTLATVVQDMAAVFLEGQRDVYRSAWRALAGKEMRRG